MPTIIATALAFLRSLVSRLAFPALGSLMPGAGLFASVATVFSAALAFLGSPVGKYVAIGLVGVSLFLVGDVHRARIDRAAYAAKVEAAKDEAAKRDAEIQRKAAAEAQASIATIQAQAASLKKQVTDYETYIAAHGGDACRATPGAAKRLRGL